MEMESLKPEIDQLENADNPLKNLFESMTRMGEEQIRKQKRKALRVLIPAIVTIAIVLIGIGIVIGKFIL